MSVQHKNECRFIGVVKPNGRYTNGFELTYTAGGTAVLTINLCVTEKFPGKDSGDMRCKNTFIPVRAWGERAEEWEKQLKLYSVIDILTVFRTSSYTTTSGEKRFDHKFDVLALRVLEQSSETEQASTTSTTRTAPAPRDARTERASPTATPAPAPAPAATAQPAPAARPAATAAPAARPAAAPAARPIATPARDPALPPVTPPDDDIPF